MDPSDDIKQSIDYAASQMSSKDPQLRQPASYVVYACVLLLAILVEVRKIRKLIKRSNDED